MNTSPNAHRTGRALGILTAAVLSVSLVTACGSSDSSGSAPASKADSANTVNTKLLAFNPEKLTVKAGTTVKWHVDDTIGHTVTTGTFTLGADGLRTAENPDGLIDMPLKPGKDVSFKFTKPGKYVYYCSIHKGMAGEIDVTP